MGCIDGFGHLVVLPFNAQFCEWFVVSLFAVYVAEDFSVFKVSEYGIWIMAKCITDALSALILSAWAPVFSTLRYFLVGQLLCTAVGWCVMILAFHTSNYVIMTAGFVLHGFGIHTAAMHAYRVGEAHGKTEKIESDTLYSSLTFLIGTIAGVVTGPALLSMGFSISVLLGAGAGLNTFVAFYSGLLMSVTADTEEPSKEERERRLSKKEERESSSTSARKYSACTMDVLSILLADGLIQFSSSAYNAVVNPYWINVLGRSPIDASSIGGGAILFSAVWMFTGGKFVSRHFPFPMDLCVDTITFALAFSLYAPFIPQEYVSWFAHFGSTFSVTMWKIRKANDSLLVIHGSKVTRTSAIITVENGIAAGAGSLLGPMFYEWVSLETFQWGLVIAGCGTALGGIFLVVVGQWRLFQLRKKMHLPDNYETNYIELLRSQWGDSAALGMYQRISGQKLPKGSTYATYLERVELYLQRQDSVHKIDLSIIDEPDKKAKI